MDKQLNHLSVLLNEAVAALNIQSDGEYFDGTFGRGGHSRAILSAMTAANSDVGDAAGKLYACDQDPEAVKVAAQLQSEDSRFYFAQGRFSAVNDLFPQLTKNSLSGALLDLGVSSPQLDDATRGFSFSRDGVLDMRMNPAQKICAKDFIATADYSVLTKTIARFGEERFAKQIARRIIREREYEPIINTKQLAEIVFSAVPAKFHVPGRHPATRTFQAIRIAVNDELGELQTVLPKLFAALKPKGRIVVIAFHSLEDDYVKRFVKQQQGEQLPPEIPVLDASDLQTIRFIGRPVRPSEEEIAANPRARSSIMRIVEKV